MAYVRPWILLDTSVLLELAKARSVIDNAEWERVRRHINRQYRYCVSWVTLKELLVKLARGDDAHFEENKKPLRLLHAATKARFLEKPPLFAIRTVLKINAAPKTDLNGRPMVPYPEWAKGVLNRVGAARNKRELKDGVRLPKRKSTHVTFDLDHLDQFENAPRLELADLLDGVRQGKIDPAQPRKLAAWLLVQCGLTPYTDDCRRLADALDAAFRYSSSLCEQARNPNYNFHNERHLGDWDDAQQLFYLCEPRVHVVTLDRDFHLRTQGSPQRSRILLYSDLRKAAGC